MEDPPVQPNCYLFAYGADWQFNYHGSTRGMHCWL